MGLFHHQDEVGPVDHFLRKRLPLPYGGDSCGFSFPTTPPVLEEALGCWAALKVCCTDEENSPFHAPIQVNPAVRASELGVPPTTPASPPCPLHADADVLSLPSGPYPPSLAQQAPFLPPNNSEGWIRFPQDNNGSITNYDAFSLDRAVDSAKTVQPPPIVDPMSMLTKVMLSKFSQKLYSRIEKTADIITDHMLGIPNTPQPQRNSNLEDDVRGANPVEGKSPEATLQPLIDRVNALKEQRAKETERQRLETQRTLDKLKEGIRELAAEMKKNSQPQTTNRSKVGGMTTAENGQPDLLSAVKVSDSRGTGSPEGSLTQPPNVEPTQPPVAATVPVSLNGEVPPAELLEARKPVTSLQSATASTADGGVSVTPKIAESMFKDSSKTSVAPNEGSETTLIDHGTPDATKPVDPLPFVGVAATIPSSARGSFKRGVDGQPDMTNPETTKPETTPGDMTTDQSGVDNGSEDSSQSSISNAPVAQPNGTLAILPIHPPRRSRENNETSQENSNFGASSHQSHASGGHQLLKVAFVVVGVGIALYLFDPTVRQWIFSHYIRLFRSSQQQANTNALTTKKPPPLPYSTQPQTPRYSPDGTHVF